MKSIKSLIASIVAIVVSTTTLLGSTYAYFNDSISLAGNKIVAGTLDVDLELLNKEGVWNSLKESETPLFDNVKWEPGYTDVKVLKVENEGSLALKWKAKFVPEGQLSALADVIDVYVHPSATELTYPEDRNLEGYVKKGTIRDFVTSIEETTTGILAPTESAYLGIALKMQNVGNEYQGLDLCGAFDIVILATQVTLEEDGFNDQYDNGAEYPKLPAKWNGTADTSWYNETDTTFTLTSAEQLAGFAELVDDGNSFEGKTIKIDSDIDFYKKDENGEPICFEPIGGCRDEKPFMGTFDGQGHTIFNVSQNTWALNNGYYYSGELGLGLFGAVENATIKNLVVDGTSISGESALCGAVVGVAMGDCTFENITIKNAQVNDYQYGAGGIVGWASGNQTYKGINVSESTVVGSQWGDFGNANGGIIGQADPEGKYHFEDCIVACRIDAVNDIVSAYQWYCYRNSGMLIGKVDNYVQDEVASVVAENVTCENVTVIYGEWANYTYCEFGGTGYPYVRVQAGVSVDAYSNVRYGHPTDANGNTVVDDNHVHNDGEDHNLLIEFDQLFGGPANHRYCYYGIATHPGVNVIYNNK